MPNELEEFYTECFQEVQARAGADHQFTEDAFFDFYCDHLIDAGELDTADRAYHTGHGMRVDGYGGDPVDGSDGTLKLIIADFRQEPDLATLGKNEMETAFKRIEKFLQKAVDTEFRSRLDFTTPAFGLADLINSRVKKVSKIQLMLISNRKLSSRVVDRLEAGEFEGRKITYNVWDIARLHQYVVSGRGREEIEVNLKEDFGGPLCLLPAHQGDNGESGYRAYLAVVPGEQLAEIYDHWGARLLEQNVRCFLQARSNVNKGIRNTIQNEPQMFFAFNNGITATAEEIETEQTGEGLMLNSLKNFQIVNGGQTTASIHAAVRKGEASVEGVFVQMKLSIIDQDKTSELVPKISQYANSQNRVNAADFFANHPFHVRIEEFSRRIFAPSSDGTVVQSKWFYERARGQYQDARAYLTTGQRKAFDRQFPKRQMFSKTDLSKFINVWEGHPYIVSKGAQKNFADFAGKVGKEFNKNPDSFNELYYNKAIAKAIIWRHLEKLVSRSEWYEGGFRAPVVVYTLAKLSHELAIKRKELDFDKVWKNQKVSDSLDHTLEVVAKGVHDVLLTPPPGMSNVGEWAKKPGCWDKIQGVHITLPRVLETELITKDEQQGQERAAVKEQRLLNDVEAQMIVVRAGSDFWRAAKSWGESNNLLGMKEGDILQVACNITNNRMPTGPQSLVIIEVLEKLHQEGYPEGLDLLKP